MSDTFDFMPKQLGLELGDQAALKSWAPDVEDVRNELMEILSAARAAQLEPPWDLQTCRYHQIVFPQMANWLPQAERDQLCFEFAHQMERIERLLAA